MDMFNPPHPGSIFREDVFASMGLTVAKAAEEIGVDRVTLSRFINEKSDLSVGLALKIEKWLGAERGGSADVWLKMQLDHNLWQARHELACA